MNSSEIVHVKFCRASILPKGSGNSITKYNQYLLFLWLSS